MGEGHKRRLVTLWLLASSLACLNLWLNFFLPTPSWAFHQRSLLWAAGCAALLVAMVPLTRLPSIGVTIGAGFLGGGVLGNLISGAADHLAVPNPLLLTAGDGGIAFNAADTFILGGNLILVIALCTLLVKNRERLRGRHAVLQFARPGARPPAEPRGPEQ